MTVSPSISRKAAALDAMSASMARPTMISCGLLVAMLGASGCRRHAEVVGRVTFVDGAPLTVGEVVLDDGRNMGRGPIQPDGSFVIGYRGDAGSIPAGVYRVAIYNSDIGGPGNWAVSPKFVDPQTSGIVFEVEPAKRNVINFQVEPNPAHPRK